MLIIRQRRVVVGRMKFLTGLLILPFWAGESRCTPAETGRWPPVRISLFYESLCPDCRAFMESELCPTWARMKEFLNVTLIPFGNAEVTQSTQSRQFRCQHGRKECFGNMIQSCMIYHLKNTSSYLPVICCMESARTVFIAAQQCLQDHVPSMSWEVINDCVNEDLGSQLMYQNAQRTNELEPSHHYVPWILINGEHSEDIQHLAETDLLDLVCRTYTYFSEASLNGTSLGALRFLLYTQVIELYNAETRPSMPTVATIYTNPIYPCEVHRLQCLGKALDRMLLKCCKGTCCCQRILDSNHILWEESSPLKSKSSCLSHG